MTIEILCTLGPASMNQRVISRLEHLGVALFRVNLSHTRLEDVEQVVSTIQSLSSVPVCLDTEGAQIRTTKLAEGTVTLRENSLVAVHSKLVPGDPDNISFYPSYTVAELQPGDFISIDFNAALTQVVESRDDRAMMRVINGGLVGSNKAVTVHRPIVMPALTDKDRAAVAIGKRLGVRHVALSFANRPEDVDELRALAGEAFVISKIECRNGLDHLDAIALKSDAILIDRGDLSREIPIERIPATQKHIIRTAKRLNRKVYVATNLLETMVLAPTPTRAEVNDIFNTLSDGADGLVLAAETAVGNYPINCATMVVKLVREFTAGDQASRTSEPFSLLPEPHGGRLNLAWASPRDVSDAANPPVTTLPETTLSDAEQMALGMFSPVNGFMGREALEGVLDHHRLPDGTPWSMPLILQAPQGCTPVAGQRLVLASAGGKPHVLMDVTERFEIDLSRLAERWFGTRSTEHPGVARLMAGSAMLVAGPVKLIERLPSPYRAYELTAEQTRFVFTQKGWTRVVAFHGRNVPHRAHEYIQLKALERTHADGLFISPVIGPRKSGDFLPSSIIRSYETLLDVGIYPKGQAILGCLSTYPRYSGPREAVFTALCRKNMGCSHIIIGRDHTGVGNFYGPNDNRRLFDTIGDIGIEPIFFDPVGWDPVRSSYVSTPGAMTISGTEVRAALTAGHPLPEWAIHPTVQEALRAELVAGRDIFCP